MDIFLPIPAFCFQCFLCRTENDFNSLCHELKVHLVQSDQAPSQSLITICDDRPSDWMLESSGNLSESSENAAVSLSGKSCHYVLVITGFAF